MNNVTLHLATETDVTAVADFYDRLIDDMEQAPFHPCWQKGIYPNIDYIRQAIDKQELVVARDGDAIAAAMVINTEANDGYLQGQWITDAAPGEYTVIHTLGVGTAFRHRGIGSRMMHHAIDAAKAIGSKSIRIDLIDHNYPAEPVYLRQGFKKCGSLRLFYDAVGWQTFHLYEYPLIEA